MMFQATAQEPDAATEAASAEAPAHEQLRELRRELESVVAKGDWEAIRPFVSERIVVTWLDGTQSHGVDAVVDYLESKTGGDSPIVDDFSLTTEVAELAELYGENTAVAYGTAESRFALRGGELSVTGPWDATMIRDGDRWKLASLSASVGAFDNPLLTWTWRLVWIVGIVAALLGLLVGWLLFRRRESAINPVEARE